MLIGCILLASAADGAVIHRIRVDGIINPVSSEFIIKSVNRAENRNAAVLLIELDTPGGLLEATRDIVQRFLAAKVPIIVYVSPSGARAGSAGVFITLAAHIAVMAPGTNIGAAHPVTIGGGGMPGGGEPDSTSKSVMNDKMTNDAAALIRSIAKERNRNIEWAEKAVRESDAITANEALDFGVIDFIAPDIDSLLILIDGMTVSLPSDEMTIEIRRAIIESFEMTWREKLFDKLTDPNLAYIFMMLGIYGLIFELSNPSSILPGVIGGICILLAFFAFQALPINAVGVLLIIFGIILLLLEIKVPSYGILTIGGAVSLLLGSLMLVDTEVPELQISLSVIIPAVIFTVLFALFAVGMGINAQRRKVATGAEGLVGQVGETVGDLDPRGEIFVNGEYWTAISSKQIPRGKSVVVKSVEGMILRVEQTESLSERNAPDTGA